MEKKYSCEMASSVMTSGPFCIEMLRSVRKILRGQECEGTATSNDKQLAPLPYILLL
jgi:hypothetical protein